MLRLEKLARTCSTRSFSSCVGSDPCSCPDPQRSFDSTSARCLHTHRRSLAPGCVDAERANENRSTARCMDENLLTRSTHWLVMRLRISAMPRLGIVLTLLRSGVGSLRASSSANATQKQKEGNQSLHAQMRFTKGFLLTCWQLGVHRERRSFAQFARVFESPLCFVNTRLAQSGTSPCPGVSAG